MVENLGAVGTFNVTDAPVDMDSDDSFEEYISNSSVTDNPPPPTPPKTMFNPTVYDL